jgi:hypothetical protein
MSSRKTPSSVAVNMRVKASFTYCARTGAKRINSTRKSRAAH